MIHRSWRGCLLHALLLFNRYIKQTGLVLQRDYLLSLMTLRNDQIVVCNQKLLVKVLFFSLLALFAKHLGS